MRRPLQGYVRQRLHRRIFLWFGASILLTGMVSALAFSIHSPERRGFEDGVGRLRRFVGGQFARVWDDGRRRDELARAAADELGIDIVLEDAGGERLAAFGGRCGERALVVPVQRASAELGRVRVCAGRWLPGGPRWQFLVALGAAGVSLWGASGLIARRLTRPLGELVRVADEIGAGRLESRVSPRHRRYGEVGVLADAINDMAGRIQRQLNDQRELLAAVSHEIRSPLARMRILLELARDAREPPVVREQLDGMERELVEINELTGKLLASARLDFSMLDAHAFDARDLALRVLERSALSATLLECREGLSVSGDPTLVARALSNLLENAVRHAGGAELVRVRERANEVEFVVHDCGDGFSEAELPGVFESFVRGKGRPAPASLGLGLGLVRRIASAHGGRAWARNREPKGAEVGFSVRHS